MFITAFATAFVASLVVSMPNDWARRRGSAVITVTATTFNVLGIAVIVLGCLAARIVPDGLSVATMVLGIITASLVADAIATRTWGSVGRA